MIWYYAKGKPKEQVSLDVNRAAEIERRLLKGRELMQQYAKAGRRRNGSGEARWLCPILCPPLVTFSSLCWHSLGSRSRRVPCENPRSGK